MADSSDDLGIPMKPSRPLGAPVGRAPAAVPPRIETRPLEPARAPEPPRRVMPEPLPASAPVPVATPAPPPRRLESEARRLTVGREISLSGEIASCDVLIVEGSVEANLQNCRDIDIAETGLFKGTASIESADVRGTFEGSLTVRKRLLIRAGGQVTGTIRYGQIEIELGGQITGDVQALSGSEADIIAELPTRAAY